jgi:allophanate hydrolase
MPVPDVFLIRDLLAGYRSRELEPTDVARAVLERIERSPERHAWINRLAPEDLMRRALALEAESRALPLYGIPFAIKDNIDLAGVPTTAACPAYAYLPEASAPVVDRLLAAGALPVGKTNLDQFATGLVGTRSPHGACRNAFDPEFIAGGSSSGSALAVATGVVGFALGTDTAGSGRVPAAFNNLVGLKPTRGRLSARGVVPACQSLDCVSIFALTAADAGRVLEVAEDFDAADPYSRRRPASGADGLATSAAFRFGVPRPAQLEFFGDGDYRRLFERAVERLEALGGSSVEVDLEPFLEAGRLLYEGPWLAERYAAVSAFLEAHPGALHPVTGAVLSGGGRPSAADAFRAQHRLMVLRRATEAVWDAIDVLVTPTAGTIYRIAEVEVSPLRLNANLGLYTNFLNLLDLAAVAVPAGFREDGLPFGVTLVGEAWADRALLALADRLHRAAGITLGALEAAVPGDDPPAAPARATAQAMDLAVRGAPSHPTVSADPYPWPYDGRFAPADTALVIIDMQHDFCGVGGYVDTMGYDVSLTRSSRDR